MLDEFETVLIRQLEKGNDKYGETIFKANLDLLDVTEHLKEEIVDSFVYLAEIERQIKEMERYYE